MVCRVGEDEDATYDYNGAYSDDESGGASIGLRLQPGKFIGFRASQAITS